MGAASGVKSRGAGGIDIDATVVEGDLRSVTGGECVTGLWIENYRTSLTTLLGLREVGNRQARDRNRKQHAFEHTNPTHWHEPTSFGAIVMKTCLIPVGN
jgi:hypothetical protein